MKKILLIITALCLCVSLQAQRHIIYSQDIASLQVVAGVRWQELPIIRLGGPEVINISFDELSHTYQRYTYRVTHLEADFMESDGLFTSDYLAGLGNLTIEDAEESINTYQLYTHYKLQIPNEDCRITMSGNYRLDVIDDNGDSDTPVLSVFFMVYEDKVPVGLSYSDNTDIDVRKNHHQVTLNVDYSRLGATDPRRQIKGYVLQNMRWDNAVYLPEAPIINQKMLRWEHCRKLIFDAGNEYHKFEMLDIHRNSLNVENNSWDGENWHTILWPDLDRPNYVYDEAPKGAFYIRNSDNRENDVTSDYVLVHFILKPKQPGPFPYPLYVNGMWTNDLFLEKYEMHYDYARKMYEAIVPLKYGYYSYQYLMLKPDGTTAIPPTEGSFYETRNKYNALIYYKSNTDRADRLVGIF